MFYTFKNILGTISFLKLFLTLLSLYQPYKLKSIIEYNCEDQNTLTKIVIQYFLTVLSIKILSINANYIISKFNRDLLGTVACVIYDKILNLRALDENKFNKSYFTMVFSQHLNSLTYLTEIFCFGLLVPINLSVSFYMM